MYSPFTNVKLYTKCVSLGEIEMNDATVVCVARDWNEKLRLNKSPTAIIKDKCYFIKFVFF